MVNNIFSRLKGQAIVAEKLGHITFAKAGFFENGKIEPEQYLWEKDELAGILNILRSDPAVELATPRLNLFGIASNGNASTIFITEATLPEDDQQLVRTNVDGRTNTRGAIVLEEQSEGRTEVAIGSELSSNLGLKEGDYFTLLTSTKEGVANAVDVDIVKVFNTGNPATNDKFVLTDFRLAQTLYDTEGAQRVVVTLKDDRQVAAAKERLLAELSGAGYAVDAQSWKDMSLFYSKIKAMFGVIFRVLMVIITFVVLLTLLNTMQMAVAERTNEIGTLRAIGMLKRQVIFLFCCEGFILSVIGCLLAIPILLFIAGLLQFLDVSFIPPVASVPISVALKFNPIQVVLVFILFSVSALVAAYLTSTKISRQKIIDSLISVN